jgi:hypothetical protein
MKYNQPPEELKAIAESLLSYNADSLAYREPATDVFYFILDAQRIARAYLKGLS